MPPVSHCAICEQPFDTSEGNPKYQPFCSKRCADLDLGAWLSDSYKISGSEEEDSSKWDETS